MRAILFHGNRIVTGDAIAEAVVEHSAALFRVQRADELEVPVIVDGRVGRCRLQLLPTVPLAWVSAGPDGESLLDGQDLAVSTQIRERTRRLETEMWF